MTEKLSTKVLDHLGLVSGMCDQLGIAQQIDNHISQNLDQRELSIGTSSVESDYRKSGRYPSSHAGS